MAKGVAVRVPVDVLERLKEISKAHYRTVGQTIAWMLKKYEEREESFDEYYERNKSFIEHSRAQEGKALSIKEVFGE